MKIAFALFILICITAGVLAQDVPATQPAEVPAADLLNRMLKPPGQAPVPLQPMVFPPPVNSVTAPGTVVAPNATTQPLVREGTFITDRTGRLTKSPDGLSAEFTFDADGAAMQDPPMLILPNLKLELMEQAVSGSNRDLKFHVTGMVTEYHNRNYLLMERVVVVPDIVQQF